jgi:hypothetical protein
MQCKKLENKKQRKLSPKISRKKQIIKIRKEIYEIEGTKNQLKNHCNRVGFLNDKQSQ